MNYLLSRGLYAKMYSFPMVSELCNTKAGIILTASEFPVIHKVGTVGISVLLSFGIEFNLVISYLNFNSKHHGNRKFAFNFIQLITISNFFPLEALEGLIGSSTGQSSTGTL